MTKIKVVILCSTFRDKHLEVVDKQTNLLKSIYNIKDLYKEHRYLRTNKDYSREC